MTDKLTPTDERRPIQNDSPEPESVLVRGFDRRVVLGVLAVVVIGLLVLVEYLLRPKPAVAVRETQSVVSGHADEGGEHDDHSQEGVVELDDETAELMGIETEQAEIGDIEETIMTTGRVLVPPNAKAVVGAKVSGRVVRIEAEPGQTVAAGRTLVVVDSPEVADLRGQLTEARARLSTAESAVARVARAESRAPAIQAENRMDLAESTLKRKQRLVEIGASARSELEAAESEFRNAKAEYDYQSNIQVAREQLEAKGEAEAVRATVTRLSDQLSALGAAPNARGGQIALSSPVSGTVVDVHTSLGEAVTPDKELLTVMNLSDVVVEAELPESQASRVARGRRLVARVPGMADGLVVGSVDSVGETVDPVKRTVSVRACVANSRALLRHEMGVEVRIAAGASKHAVTVSVSALVDDDGLKVVYVREDNRYERRVVEIGSISYDRAEIVSGLEAGEDVVSAGAYQVANARSGGGEEGGHDDDH